MSKLSLTEVFVTLTFLIISLTIEIILLITTAVLFWNPTWDFVVVSIIGIGISCYYFIGKFYNSKYPPKKRSILNIYTWPINGIYRIFSGHMIKEN